MAYKMCFMFQLKERGLSNISVLYFQWQGWTMVILWRLFLYCLGSVTRHACAPVPPTSGLTTWLWAKSLGPFAQVYQQTWPPWCPRKWSTKQAWRELSAREQALIGSNILRSQLSARGNITSQINISWEYLMSYILHLISHGMITHPTPNISW